MLLTNAPINVNPEGGGGRAKGGDLINQVVPWVRIWTDTFFLSGPRVGIFDRLTLISDDIHSRTQSPSYTRRDEGLWPNPKPDIIKTW